ncbi:MAG TPA: DUF5602 domain-containing protein [Pyrinomonadaceae bacterium]
MMSCRLTTLRRISTALALLLLVIGMALTQGAAFGAGKQQKRRRFNSPAKSRVGTFVGATRPLGSGSVRSWVTLDEAGRPSAVGLTFSESALKTAPTELPKGRESVEINLPLPKEARGTAFDHIGFDWNPMGHPPANIYTVPHFDIHFYTISVEEQERITAQGEDLARCYKKPGDEYVPAGYILPPDTAVPRMGAHWIDPSSSELKGQPFTRTFLYGNYDGKLIFFEPMIARSFFETKTNITEKIKLPQRYAKPGYYPTSYSVRYDAVRKEYTVALEGMTLR